MQTATMDFFEQQDHARRHSGRLVLYFVLAVVAVALSVHVLVALLGAFMDDSAGVDFAEMLFSPTLFLWTVGIAVGIMAISALLKLSSLRGGGSQVAESLGGREVLPGTGDLRERRLLNIVEEMALASGIRVPRVYVLDEEPGFNAFAAGYSQEDAAVAVTGGLLDALNREELQAVVGHEFSHILNGDMRLNLRLIAGLGGILGLAVAGRVAMQIAGRGMHVTSGRRSSRKDNSGALVLAIMVGGLVVWVVGSLGVFFARIIQSAVSRQREFLADASAVQFTRNPEGMAKALQLIGAAAHRGRLQSARATEVSHMLFVGGGRNIFATHPDLVTRIRRISPAFDGDFEPARKTLQRRAEERKRETGAKLGDDDGLNDLRRVLGRRGRRVLRDYALNESMPGPGGADSPLPPPLPAATPLSSVPQPPPLPSGAGDLSLSWLSEDERSALREADSAECCLYGAILSDDIVVKARQLDMLRIAKKNGSAFAEAAEGWQQRHAGRKLIRRRMTCELAAERLRGEPADYLKALVKNIDALSLADGTMDSFEFALARLLRRRFSPPSPQARKSPLPAMVLKNEIYTVFHALVSYPERDPEEAAAAWDAALERFGLLDKIEWDAMRPPPPLAEFERALEALIRLEPLQKRELLSACEALVRQDGVITEAEENYLRSVADGIEAMGWGMRGMETGEAE